MDSTPLDVKFIPGGSVGPVAACLEDLDNPRSGNAALHDFHTLLFIALCSVLCGGQGAVDMAIFAKAKESFLREVLDLKNGRPSTRYVQPAVPPHRSRRVPRRVPAVHDGILSDLERHRRD